MPTRPPHAAAAPSRRAVPRRRVHDALAACILSLCATAAVPAQLGAQASVSVNRYSPGVLPTDGFWVRRPQTLGHLEVAAQLQTDLSYKPLVFDRIDNDPDPIALVDAQLTTHTSVALGFLDHFIAFAGVPVHVLLDGTHLPGQPQATGFGAGDLYFGAGGGFTTHDGRSGGGGRIVISAPTSEEGNGGPGTAGESTSTLSFEVSGEMPAGAISLAANAGLRFREDKRVGTTSFSDEFNFGAGAIYSMRELLDIYLELVATASTENVAGGATTTMEASLGGKYHLDRSWLVGAAGGAGIAPAYGTPIARGIVMVGWHTPTKARPVDVPVDDRAGYRSDPEPQWEPEPEIEREPQPEPEPRPTGKKDAPAAAPTVATEAAFDDPARRDSDGDGVSDLDDRCPIVPGTSADMGCARSHTYDPQTGHFVFSKEIAFEANKPRTRRVSAPVLDEVAATLKANPDFKVRVEAHTVANRGTRKAMKLSQNRAAAAAIELFKRGIEPARIEALGCGANRPMTTSRRLGRAKNERIEIWVTHPLPKAGMPSSLGCQAPNAPETPTGSEQ